MTPLLEGTDGIKKMSKSMNNYIGINEEPIEIFGKIMSISDELMLKYFEFLTEKDLQEVKTMHPKQAKMLLGEEIVAQFYDQDKAKKAKEEFERTFSQKQTPDDIPEFRLKKGKNQNLADILLETSIVESKNEFRRLLKQNAISCDGNKIDDENWAVKPGIIKVGKRRFLRIVE